MLSQLRNAVTPIKMKLAAPLARAHVDPNHVTLAAIPLSLGACALATWGHPLLGLCLAIPAAAADFLDGAVAELQNRKTPQGNFLEAVVDRVVEGLLLAGLATRYPVLAIVAITFSFTVSYIKARVGLVLSTDNSDWPGLGDRTDRLALVLLAYLAEGLKGGAAPLLGVLIALGIVGSLQRLRHAFKLIGQAQKEGSLLPYLQAEETRSESEATS